MANAIFYGGGGPRVLLLHSGFSPWMEWRRVIDALTPEFEVLAPTLPGSVGGPPLNSGRMLVEHVEYAKVCMDERGWDDKVLAVGSSFGACDAIELLGRERVRAVIAFAPPWTVGPGVAFYGAGFAAYLAALRIDRPVWNRVVERPRLNGLLVQGARVGMAIDEADMLAMLDSWARFPLFRVGIRSLRSGPGMPDFSRVDSEKVTLVWGGKDRVVPSWMRTRWEAMLPRSRTIELDGFPHIPHLRDPNAVIGLIRSSGNAVTAEPSPSGQA